jgi:hypothetical protein
MAVPKIPKDWGEDPLSEFLQQAHDNTIATFAHLRPEYNRLREIHVFFLDLIKHLDHSPDWFSTLFAMRAHASYLGAVRIALSGQLPETYILLRGCLENALYGLYFQRNPASREIWLRRGEDEASRRRAKNEFLVGKLFSCLEAVDRNTHQIAKALYDDTIDSGGHPNPDGILQSVTSIEEADNLKFITKYMHADPLHYRVAMKQTAQAGVCSLDIFRNVFQQRFDILGLTNRLRQLKARL